MKIAKYLALELLFIILVINNYGLFIDMDKGDQTCLVGIVDNYLTFGRNNYFHWFREDLNQVCRFEGRILIGYMWFVLSYYTLLKVYGAIRCPVSGKAWFIAGELLAYLGAFIYKMFQPQDIIMTWGSLGNAVIGSILVFAPLIIYAILISVIRFLIIKHWQHIRPYWQTHQNLHIAMAYFFGSLFIFPPVTTIFYQIILAPLAFAYLYLYLPYILKRYLLGISGIPNNPLKNIIKFLSCGLLITLLFISELFMSALPLSSPSEFLANFCLYLIATAMLRGFIYLLIFFVWEPKKTKTLIYKSCFKG